MPKRCPPGVMCVENATLSFYILIIGALIYMLLKNNQLSVINMMNTAKSNLSINENYPFNMPHRQPLNNPYVSLGDPYNPPLKKSGFPSIATQGGGGGYSQIGFLSKTDGSNIMLPLMGRLLLARRDKWNYYCLSDSNNSIRLPVVASGKSCTGEQGCDDLNNGDTVYVEGYNDAFNVTMYDRESNVYVPW